MVGPSPRLAMVAGEASGDLLATLLLRGLKARWPQLCAAGIGGPGMVSEGFEAWWPSERLAVRGYVEVLRHYRGLLRLREQLGSRLLAQRPHVFVGVDAPDFNLGLEQRLREGGLRTVHFVCPSIWAWRPKRIERIRASAEHVLCLFPFEPALLQRHGIAATYVGHPLADAIPMQVPRAQARAQLGLQADDEVVALLPGSRVSEVEHIAPLFLRAAVLMQRQRPGLRFLLPAAPGLGPRLQALVQQHAPGLQLMALQGRSHEALAACDVTLIASGTATLEAALFKRPMVIGYHMNALSWAIMKRQQLQPWVGLPNILCEEFVVPERLQSECRPDTLAHDTLAWLDDAPRRDRLAQRFELLHHLLRQDTATRATHAIETILQA